MTISLKQFIIIITSINILFSQTGTWKLAPAAGALKVGPYINDGLWWSNTQDDIETRACLFDDEYVFNEGGAFTNVLDSTTWLEPWQGDGITEGCGVPIAPHDGSNTATWNYDESVQTITITGVGAFLGLAKAVNGADLSSPQEPVPESRTYSIVFMDSGIMIVSIARSSGYWTFKFVQEGIIDVDVNVTFSVDMTLEETHPEGVYIAGGYFGQDGLLMYDTNGDDIWEKTASLPIGETIYYKFRNRPSYGTWDGFEPGTGLISDSCVAGSFNDRFLLVPAVETVLDTVCYGSCTNCESINVVNVSFSLNMNDMATDPAGPHLSGEDFPAPGLPMLDPDGDDVWTITVEQTPGALLRYKFANGPVPNWQGNWENVPAECQHEEVGNSNRWVIVGEMDTVVDTVCFGSCTNCIDNYPVDVTFNLDMIGVADFDGSEQPYVFGSYNNWDNFTSPTMLSDDDQDNIYTGTVLDLMYQDSITVLFGYGQNFESVPSECSVYDSELIINVRPLPIGSAEGDTVLVLLPVAYGECLPDSTPRALFQVDVSTVVAEWPDNFSLCVTGTFDGWTGCGSVLTDDNRDNIYTGIVTDLEDGTDYEYKFLVNSQWGIATFESGAPLGSSCDFNPIDDYNNYGFTAVAGPEPLNLGVHLWNECPQLSSAENKGGFVPTKFSYKAYPNPFNPYVNISYTLPNTELVDLSIVNLLGQKIRTLVNTTQDPGEYYCTWAGKDVNGVTLQSGIYFAVINRKARKDVLKITFLK